MLPQIFRFYNGHIYVGSAQQCASVLVTSMYIIIIYYICDSGVLQALFTALLNYFLVS